MAVERPVHEHDVDVRERERRRPRRVRIRSRPPLRRAFATRASPASTARATFSGSPRRSPGTSATTGRSRRRRRATSRSARARSRPRRPRPGPCASRPGTPGCAPPHPRRGGTQRRVRPVPGTTPPRGEGYLRAQLVHERHEPVARARAVVGVARIVRAEEALLDDRLEAPDDREGDRDGQGPGREREPDSRRRRGRRPSRSGAGRSGTAPTP